MLTNTFSAYQIFCQASPYPLHCRLPGEGRDLRQASTGGMGKDKKMLVQRRLSPQASSAVLVAVGPGLRRDDGAGWSGTAIQPHIFPTGFAEWDEVGIVWPATSEGWAFSTDMLQRCVRLEPGAVFDLRENRP